MQVYCNGTIRHVVETVSKEYVIREVARISFNLRGLSRTIFRVDWILFRIANGKFIIGSLIAESLRWDTDI